MTEAKTFWLFAIDPLDPVTYLVGAVLLVVLAAIASYLFRKRPD